jgi:hypothetical protein
MNNLLLGPVDTYTNFTEPCSLELTAASVFEVYTLKPSSPKGIFEASVANLHMHDAVAPPLQHVE